MRAGHHAGGCLFGCDTGAHGKPAAHTFGHGHDIGLCIFRPLMREELTCSARAALDFVINQQDAFFVAKLAQSP